MAIGMVPRFSRRRAFQVLGVVPLALASLALPAPTDEELVAALVYRMHCDAWSADGKAERLELWLSAMDDVVEAHGERGRAICRQAAIRMIDQVRGVV